MKRYFRFKNYALVLVSTSLAACIGSGGGEVNLESNIDLQSRFDVNAYALNKLVCDPFGGDDGGVSPYGGIKANLYYIPQDSTPLPSVLDYIEQGTKSDQNLFFNSLYVPTRLFSLGFPLETGDLVKDNLDNDLVENFALDFDTVIKLGPDDEAGYYEFAILSDDGAILRLRENGEYVTVVDNDGNHPTRMGCSDRVFYFDHDTEYLAQILYHQGPRHHISIIPLWRKVDDLSIVGNDSECGKQGNNRYFDYNNNSIPRPAYLGLLDRDWKPLSSENYSLSNTALFNPCLNGQAPIITDLNIMDYFDGQFNVSWKTDILATSQVRIVNMDTGEEIFTHSDNILRLNHEVFISGLERNVNYLVQAVSISETFGKSFSYALNIRIN